MTGERRPTKDKPTYANGGLDPGITGRGVRKCGYPTARFTSGRWIHGWCEMGMSLAAYLEAAAHGVLA